jgi:hypothetical protein
VVRKQQRAAGATAAGLCEGRNDAPPAQSNFVMGDLTIEGWRETLWRLLRSDGDGGVKSDALRCAFDVLFRPGSCEQGPCTPSELPCRRPLTSTPGRAAWSNRLQPFALWTQRECEVPLSVSPRSSQTAATRRQPLLRPLPTKTQCVPILLWATRTRLLTCKQTFRAISNYHRPRPWAGLNRTGHHDALDIAGMPLSSQICPCYVQMGNFSTFMRAKGGTRERAARTERAEGPPATVLAA